MRRGFLLHALVNLLSVVPAGGSWLFGLLERLL